MLLSIYHGNSLILNVSTYDSMYNIVHDDVSKNTTFHNALLFVEHSTKDYKN
jgi:hypothetical protein